MGLVFFRALLLSHSSPAGHSILPGFPLVEPRPEVLARKGSAHAWVSRVALAKNLALSSYPDAPGGVGCRRRAALPCAADLGRRDSLPSAAAGRLGWVARRARQERRCARYRCAADSADNPKRWP